MTWATPLGGRTVYPSLAVYKTLKKYALPLLYTQMHRMFDTGFNAGDFNHARLCLIPKDDTMCVDRMRPIAINNMDNRIIARAIVITMLPAFDAIVSKRQKMFIRGRHMTEHIFELNDLFHQAVLDKTQRFALFLDTRKAFDSIHHDFLIRILRHQKLPQWFITFVENT